jgi:hypothetical protein
MIATFGWLIGHFISVFTIVYPFYHLDQDSEYVCFSCLLFDHFQDGCWVSFCKLMYTQALEAATSHPPIPSEHPGKSTACKNTSNFFLN